MKIPFDSETLAKERFDKLALEPGASRFIGSKSPEIITHKRTGEELFKTGPKEVVTTPVTVRDQTFNKVYILDGQDIHMFIEPPAVISDILTVMSMLTAMEEL